MEDKSFYDRLLDMLSNNSLLFERVNPDGTFTKPSNEALLTLTIVGLDFYAHSDLTFEEALEDYEVFEFNSVEEYNRFYGTEFKTLEELSKPWDLIFILYSYHRGYYGVYGTNRFIELGRSTPTPCEFCDIDGLLFYE